MRTQRAYLLTLICLLGSYLAAGDSSVHVAKAEGRGSTLTIDFMVKKGTPHGLKLRVADPEVYAADLAIAEEADSQGKSFERDLANPQTLEDRWQRHAEVLRRGIRRAKLLRKRFSEGTCWLDIPGPVASRPGHMVVTVDLAGRLVLGQAGPIHELLIRIGPTEPMRMKLDVPVDFGLSPQTQLQFALAPAGLRRLVPAKGGFSLETRGRKFVDPEFDFAWLWLPTVWQKDNGAQEMSISPERQVWARDGSLGVIEGSRADVINADLAQTNEAIWSLIWIHQAASGWEGLFRVEEPANPGNPEGQCGAGTNTDLVFATVSAASRESKVQVVNLDLCYTGLSIEEEAKADAAGPWIWRIRDMTSNAQRRIIFDPEHLDRGIQSEPLPSAR